MQARVAHVYFTAYPLCSRFPSGNAQLVFHSQMRDWNGGVGRSNFLYACQSTLGVLHQLIQMEIQQATY